ncbi:MAG TPA: signal peptidase II [Candidatus Binataceae bacterium]
MVSEAAGAPPQSVQTATPRRHFARLLGLVTIPILILDQATKLYVMSHMALYESIPIVRNWLDITYTQNPGAAFSMFADMPGWFRAASLFTISLGAIVILLIMLLQSDRLTMNSFAFALILAGAAGNVIDRAIRGRVVDFIRMHYYDLNYPVFNVADSAITIGVALILLGALMNRSDSA